MLFQLKCFIFIIKFDNILIIKDFLFEFIVYINITLYAHLIDIKIYKTFIKNDIDRIVKIFKKIRFNMFFEFNYEDIYNCENIFFVE